MLLDQITIVGVGLIGGSVGLAARARKLAGKVVGVGRDPKALARAVELGALDSFTTDLAAGVRDANLVVVCTPVDRIAGTILTAAPHVRHGATFTDAGSTKAKIVAATAGELPPGVEFIPAHPIAGSEKTGVEHARHDLFENRVTIVTPTDQNTFEAIGRVVWFWQALGSRVSRDTPDGHDDTLAVTSHLPHAVAAAVAHGLPADYESAVGTGFRDVTRIAAGDPGLWAAIFAENRDAVLAALAGFTGRLDEFRRLLEAGDGAGLVRWLSEAKQVRDALGS